MDSKIKFSIGGIKEAQQEMLSLGKSFSDLKKEYKSLNSQSFVGKTPKEIADIRNRLAELKDEMGNYRQMQDSLDEGNKFKNIAGSVSVLTSTMAGLAGAYSVFGGESENLNKITETTIGLIGMSQGAQQIADAFDQNVYLKTIKRVKEKISLYLTEKLTVTAVSESNKAAAFTQNLWNKAVASNPLVAMTVVVAALAAGIYLLVQSQKDSNKQMIETIKNGKEYKEAYKGAIESNTKNITSLLTLEEGTAEYTKTLDELTNQYGRYLNESERAILANGTQTEKTDVLTLAIQRQAQMLAYATLLEKLYADQIEINQKTSLTYWEKLTLRAKAMATFNTVLTDEALLEKDKIDRSAAIQKSVKAITKDMNLLNEGFNTNQHQLEKVKDKENELIIAQINAKKSVSELVDFRKTLNEAQLNDVKIKDVLIKKTNDLTEAEKKLKDQIEKSRVDKLNAEANTNEKAIINTKLRLDANYKENKQLQDALKLLAETYVVKKKLSDEAQSELDAFGKMNDGEIEKKYGITVNSKSAAAKAGLSSKLQANADAALKNAVEIVNTEKSTKESLDKNATAIKTNTELLTAQEIKRKDIIVKLKDQKASVDKLNDAEKSEIANYALINIETDKQYINILNNNEALKNYQKTLEINIKTLNDKTKRTVEEEETLYKYNEILSKVTGNIVKNNAAMKESDLKYIDEIEQKLKLIEVNQILMEQQVKMSQRNRNAIAVDFMGYMTGAKTKPKYFEDYETGDMVNTLNSTVAERKALITRMGELTSPNDVNKIKLIETQIKRQDELYAAQLAQIQDFQNKQTEILVNAETERANLLNNLQTAALQNSFNLTQQWVDAEFDYKIERMNDFYDQEQERSNQQAKEYSDKLNIQVEEGLISSERANYLQSQADMAKEEKDKERENKRLSEERKLVRKQAIYQRGIDIAQIATQTALAVMQSLAQYGPVLGASMLPIIYGMGAIQAATVLAQPLPRLEKGGLIGGNRHSQGGTILEAENGEFIVNRMSMQNPVNAAMVQYINNPNANMDNMINNIINKIVSIPVIVSEKDISNTQRKVGIINNKTNLF